MIYFNLLNNLSLVLPAIEPWASILDLYISIFGTVVFLLLYIGGLDGNRTRDRGFADPGLTTWLPGQKCNNIA